MSSPIVCIVNPIGEVPDDDKVNGIQKGKQAHAVCQFMPAPRNGQEYPGKPLITSAALDDDNFPA